MKSIATRRFWILFRALPLEVQELAIKNYELWRRDPKHPSLHFRRLQGSADRFSIRIGDHYRALGILTGDAVTWVWIGSHADYDASFFLEVGVSRDDGGFQRHLTAESPQNPRFPAFPTFPSL